MGKQHMVKNAARSARLRPRTGSQRMLRRQHDRTCSPRRQGGGRNSSRVRDRVMMPFGGAAAGAAPTTLAPAAWARGATAAGDGGAERFRPRT